MTSAIQGEPGLPQSALPSIQTSNEAADAPPPTEAGTVEGKRRAAAAGMRALIAARKRARQSPPASTFPLQLLPPIVKSAVAIHFLLGGEEASMLTATSPALRIQWHERALADKLVSALKSMSDAPVDQAGFLHIIDVSNRLPPGLQFGVLRLIPEKLGKNLQYACDHMEEVIAALINANHRLAVEPQFLMMDKISRIFMRQDFRTIFQTAGNTTIDSAAMKENFDAFRTELARVCSSNGKDVVGFMHRLHEQNKPADVADEIPFNLDTSCQAFFPTWPSPRHAVCTCYRALQRGVSCGMPV